MIYTKLGKSDLNVSRICMGCMGIGDPSKSMNKWSVPEEESREIIRYALDQGINFFDTAMSYQEGNSEEVLGKALKDFAKRDDYIVATKFLPRSQEELDRNVPGQAYVADCLDRSLKRLGLDYVDLYIYHMWDYHTPMEEIIEGLNNAVKAGKTRYVGISNCYAWQLAKANFYARENGFAEFISVQGHYNLIAREEEREMIPFCEDQGIALTPYSPLASGRLCRPAGETTKRLEMDGYARFKYDKSQDADAGIIERVKELAESKNVLMTEISLAWLLRKVTAPVMGVTKKSNIDGAVKAVELEFTQEETDYLEELYVPHALAGVMAQNGKQKAGDQNLAYHLPFVQGTHTLHRDTHPIHDRHIFLLTAGDQRAFLACNIFSAYDKRKYPVNDALDLRRDGIPVDRHRKHNGIRLQDCRCYRIEVIIKGTGLPCGIAGFAGMASAYFFHGGIKPGNCMPLLLCRFDKSLRHGKTVTIFTRAPRNNNNFLTHTTIPPLFFFLAFL